MNLILRLAACSLLVFEATGCVTCTSRVYAKIEQPDSNGQEQVPDIRCTWVARYKPVVDAAPFFLAESESGEGSELTFDFTQPLGKMNKVEMREVELIPPGHKSVAVGLLKTPLSVRFKKRTSLLYDPLLRREASRDHASAEFIVNVEPHREPYAVRLSGFYVSKNGVHSRFNQLFFVEIRRSLVLQPGAHSPN